MMTDYNASATVSQANSTANVQNAPEVWHGIVKWFDARKGFGFISPIGGGKDGNGKGQDIFVHILDLHPKRCPTPTLFTGEYVQYQLVPTTDGTGRLKAHNVTGIYGHTLLCDHGKVKFKHYSRVGFDEDDEDADEEKGEADTAYTAPCDQDCGV